MLRIVKNALFLLICGLTLFSCATFKEPELVKFNGIKFNKMEERSVYFTLQATAKNPNAYSLKLKPCHVNVFLQDQLIGKVSIEKKVKLKKRTEAMLTFPMRAELEEGAMLTILRLSLKDQVEVRVQGKIRMGASILSGRFPVDTSRVISGNMLKFEFPK